MKTDWDRYYRHPYKTATYSRRIMGSRLLRLIARFADLPAGGARVVELGGGNSCFYPAIRKAFSLERYHVIDNNRRGLEMLKEAFPSDPALALHEGDLLHLELSLEADLAFSVGLIEHFSVPETERLIMAHFRLARPGGTVIIGFPTPTLLYRLTRALSEAMGLWIFPDERPLSSKEALPAIQRGGRVLDRCIVWPMFLTQMVVTARNGVSGG